VTSRHVSILVEPIVRLLLEPFRALPIDAPPHWFVDCTFGGGGHTRAFLEALAADPALQRHKVLGVDQDLGALERGRKNFDAEIAQGRLELLHSRFSDLDLMERPVLGLLADLGFSSDQMDDPSRGLSFRADGPLDMRLNPDSGGPTCRDLLTRISERELVRILSEYGEERFSGRIASAIIDRRRQDGVPHTTGELADLIVRAVPPPARHGRIHAATRTFQALRIAVNGELEELDCLLNRVILSMKPSGRAAIISFHSLEDRRVKQAFKAGLAGQDGEPLFRPVTKKPIEPDEEEIQRNPRSRSAKLRVAERLSGV
jgi:16S rRNA (cytosine1402-N4)-methyltransferase